MIKASDIKVMDYWTARSAIQNNIAEAIKHGTGAEVEVTMTGGRFEWCVSGRPDEVVKSRPVLALAGLKLAESSYDEELAETFDYYVKG